MKRVLIGYDIGGTSARAALFSLDAASPHEPSLAHTIPVDVLVEPLRLDRSPEALFKKMRSMTLELLSRNDIHATSQVHAIGVGLAAQLDTASSHVFNAPNLGWRALDLLPILQRAWAATGSDGLASHDPGALVDRVYFFNDLNAYIYGDVCVRGLKEPERYRDVLGVAAGTGVGAAIVSSGRLLLGARGQAGELGHVKVESPTYGRLCGCGERGCLEAYVGGVHLEAEIERLIAESAPDWAENVQRSTEDASQSGVRIDLGAADAISHEVEALDLVFERAADYFSRAVGAAVTLINPQVLLLGGGVWSHAPRWRERVLAQLGAHVLAVSGELLRVESLGQAEHLSTLGAALLAMHRSRELIRPPDPC